MQDVLKSLSHRKTKIEAPYVSANGKCNDPEEDFVYTYAVALRKDGKGAYYRKASDWSQVQLSKNPYAALFFAQTLFLLMEQNNEGSVRPRRNFVDSPRDWYALCELAAEVALGTPSMDKRKHLQKLTVCDKQINLRFLVDLEVAKQRYRVRKAHIEKQKKQKKKRPANEAEDDGADDGAEELQELLNLSHEAPERPAIQPAPTTAWVSMDAMVEDERLRPCLQEVCVDDMKRQALIVLKRRQWNERMRQFQMDMEQFQEEAELVRQHVAQATSHHEEDDLIPGMPEWPEWDSSKPELTKKIQMTLTAIPEEGGDPNNSNDIIADLLRFFIRDPEINVGAFFRKIERNAEARKRRQRDNRGRLAQEELFPTYQLMFHSQHPAANSTTAQTYFRCALEYNPLLNANGAREDVMWQQMNFESMQDPFHMNNVLSMTSALRILRECGCDLKYCSNEADWFNHGARQAIFPQELMTYRYVTEGCFWHHPTYVGLEEQLFPYMSLDQDFLAQLMAGADVRVLMDDDGNSRVHPNADARKICTSMQEVQEMISKNWLIERTKIQDNNMISYRTNNEFVHRYASMLLINSAVEKHFPAHYRNTYDQVQEYRARYGAEWRGMLDDAQLIERVEQCDTYNNLRNRVSDACMKVFRGLWLLEGNVDDLPIPESIRGILKWYRDLHQSKLPHMTRQFLCPDPDMGLFSSAILRMNLLITDITKTVHPMICILSIGLLSCHYQGRGLAFNMLGHGWHAVGKTRTAIQTPQKFIFLKPVILEYTTSTSASDNTQRHVYDQIIMSDEVMAYKVDPKEAEKHQQLVNKEKVKMVSNQLGHNVFKMITLEDGTSVRWSDLVMTDHFVTLVEVTNKEVTSKDALSSRYFRFTMPLPRVPIYQMGQKIGKDLEDSTSLYFRMGHYLMCCAMKCSAVGGILQEPHRELWADFSGRVIDYLTENKSINAEDANRGLDIMWPLVRQYIYMYAVHCAFDMPGGPCYKKKFELDDIRQIEPYLYCTYEIFYFGWTALASQWVDDNRCKFIHAVEKLTGYSKVASRIQQAENERISNYNVFENDLHDEVAWRTTDVTGADPLDKQRGDNKLINLTYVTLQGDMKSVADQISKVSDLSPTDCLGLLNDLTRFNFFLQDGQYKEMPRGSARKFHKFRADGSKETDTQGTNTMPPQFLHNNPDKTMPRTEDDVLRKAVDVPISAVVIDNRTRQIHIVPGIADRFKSSVIQEALVYATMCDKFPEGKMMLGMPTDDNTLMLQSMDFDRSTITDEVAALDEYDGWGRDCDTGLPQWQGPAHIRESHRPVSRADGIMLNRRAAITGVRRDVFVAAPLTPMAEGADWHRMSSASLDSVSESRLVVEDFDYENALRWHLARGAGFDEPVPTPAFIKARMQRAAAAEGVAWTAHKQYPHDFLADQAENEAMWKQNSVPKDIDGWRRRRRGAFDPMRKRSKNNDTAQALSSAVAAAAPVVVFHAPSPPALQRVPVVPRAGAHSKKKRTRPPPSAVFVDSARMMNMENIE